MIFLGLPNVFGAYLDGARQANRDNWQDLLDSNRVTAGYLDNDRRQVANALQLGTFDDQLAISNANARRQQNAAAGSDLSLEIANAGQPGALAQAEYASSLYDALTRANAPYIETNAQNNALANWANSDSAASAALAANQEAWPTYAQRAQNARVLAEQQGALLPQQYTAKQTELDAIEAQNRVARTGAQYNNLLLQQALANPNPTPVAGTQTSAGGDQLGLGNIPVDVRAVRTVLSNLNPGGEVDVKLTNGQTVRGGRDTQGLYIILNGKRSYISQAAPPPINDILSWGAIGGAK